MSQKLPYDGCTEDFQVMFAISQGRLPGGPQGNDHSDGIPGDSVAWLVIAYCWVSDPVQRPTCKEVDEYFTTHLLNAGAGWSDILLERAQNFANTAETSAPSRFWEVVKKKSGVKVDFSRIHRLLLEVGSSSRQRLVWDNLPLPTFQASEAGKESKN